MCAAVIADCPTLAFLRSERRGDGRQNASQLPRVLCTEWEDIAWTIQAGTVCALAQRRNEWSEPLCMLGSLGLAFTSVAVLCWVCWGRVALRLLQLLSCAGCAGVAWPCGYYSCCPVLGMLGSRGLAVTTVAVLYWVCWGRVALRLLQLLSCAGCAGVAWPCGSSSAALC
jgi:hypothetical protein